MPLPTVIVQGNVCLDPQLTLTDSGKARLTLRVAAGERKKVGDDWVDGETTFVNCTIWGFQAEAASESITKGTPIVVVGKLRSYTYDNKEGAKVTAFEVNVESVAVDVKRAAKAEPADPWATNSPF
jgi:single-strand DNA-binding protein